MTGEGETRAADALVIPPAELDQVVRHLRRALPNEGVGLLGVERVERGAEVIALARQFYPGSNCRASPTRYEMDRHDLIAALRDIDRRGWELGAIVHSHPLGPARPSPTDLAEFQYPEALMVIASFGCDPPDLNAWRLELEGESWRSRNVPILDDDGWKTGPLIAETGPRRE
ncbi:MAG: M67 family metallopeptidase [Chloroflexia bacterium]|nr:M67 family metallopeptidase [Chloroflexia bacterium]